MIRLFFLVFTFLVNTTQLFAQPETKVRADYTAEEKLKANSALNANYLTDEEKQVIYYCNLARIDGKLFNELYLQPYIKNNDVPRDRYVTGLVATLKKQKSIQILLPQEDLYNCAKDHAVKNGTTGAIGHQRYSQRFKKYAPNYRATAENCDYGNKLGLDIVMSLLIDQGVSDLGHRKNILNPTLNSVGVCIYTHKKYGHQCVMDFGNKK